MNSEGEFARMQPEYAARGIATFPISFNSKKPAITNYLRVGKPASAKLAAGYHRSADAFGFALDEPFPGGLGFGVRHA